MYGAVAVRRVVEESPLDQDSYLDWQLMVAKIVLEALVNQELAMPNSAQVRQLKTINEIFK